MQISMQWYYTSHGLNTALLWTWKSHGDKVHCQIDYILTSKLVKSNLLGVKSIPEADIYSDHVPFKGKMRLKFTTTKKTPTEPQARSSALKSNKEIREI